MLWNKKHERRIRALLEDLSGKGVKRNRELMRMWIVRHGTFCSFCDALKWLKQKGYVQKVNTFVQSPYQITENGKKYLELVSKEG